MLATAELVRLVAGAVTEFDWPNYVCDPVMVATSGDRLLDADAEAVMRENLVPLAALVTPNLDEAAILTGADPRDPESMEQAGRSSAGAGRRRCIGEGRSPGRGRGNRRSGHLRWSPQLSSPSDQHQIHSRHRLHAFRSHHRWIGRRSRRRVGGYRRARFRVPRNEIGSSTRIRTGTARSHGPSQLKVNRPGAGAPAS